MLETELTDSKGMVEIDSVTNDVNRVDITSGCTSAVITVAEWITSIWFSTATWYWDFFSVLPVASAPTLTATSWDSDSILAIPTGATDTSSGICLKKVPAVQFCSVVPFLALVI